MRSTKRKHFCHQTPLYETIYTLFYRLLPDLRDLAPGEVRQCEHLWQTALLILSQDRYTTIVALEVSFCNPSLPNIQMKLRAYHDARVAEVTEYQGQGHILPDYRYPNPSGFQADEKRQVNQLLREWLYHIQLTGAEFSTLKNH